MQRRNRGDGVGEVAGTREDARSIPDADVRPHLVDDLGGGREIAVLTRQPRRHRRIQRVRDERGEREQHEQRGEPTEAIVRVLPEQPRHDKDGGENGSCHSKGHDH